ncbi:DUF4167 domain-containing protein [Paracoccus limosus]|uniref:DUF4167 domain-containing protein n=1 Tax=Paracoccus limosus TaxID=913252 RepID=A0A844H601_9RHOB|nr:DUF4167 domain-containing protein [Paracoccus limosus]MTH35003.1 DUF4167 domain-containing protein [Paracoccus limosus]
MRSSKSRSRNKSNRQRTLGNIVNRVFDSSGPEGKVRGTPQQIIEKYLTLARDAQLSNDRVAEQSFLQHAEHYTRMLGEAQREMAERQGHQNGFSRDEDREDGQPGEACNTQPRHDRPQERGDDNRRDNRNDNRRDDNRRDERRDDNRRDERRDENRRDENRRDDRRQPRPEVVATEQSGLPPVISADDVGDEAVSGPVATPETAAEPARPQVEAPAAEPAPQPHAADEVATPAEEAPAEAADKPAPRRRTRAAAPAGTAAPRSRRKPAAEGDAAPAAEKASGE